jgi:hypothetical protein
MQEVLRKLRFQGAGTVLHAPSDLDQVFAKLGFRNDLDRKAKRTQTLVFVRNKAELLAFLKNDLQRIEPDSLLWFAYPKGSSKVKTDINRDRVRETGEQFGITTVTAVSIDDTWSALRFRPTDRVGK